MSNVQSTSDMSSGWSTDSEDFEKDVASNPDPQDLRQKLFKAIDNFEIEKVQQLLYDGADPRFHDIKSPELAPIHNVVKSQSVENGALGVLMELLLEHGADPNATDVSGATLLHYAAGRQNDTVTRILLNHRADLSSKDKWYSTPLHIAAREGNYSNVALLIAHEADISATDKSGCTPLHLAAIRGHNELFGLLSGKVSVPEAHRGYADKQWKAFELAVKNEDEDQEIMKRLLARTKHIEKEDGERLLEQAVDKKWWSLVESLLKRGIYPKDEKNNTRVALKSACEKGWVDIIQCILEEDANFNGEYGDEALKLATDNMWWDILSLFVKKGVGFRSEARMAVLDLALEQGWGGSTGHANEWQDLLVILLQKGMNIGENVLTKAKGKSSATLMNSLVNRADREALDASNILLWAIDSFQFEEIEAAEEREPKLLNQAEYDLVESLVRAGVDLNIRGSDNLTPLDRAKDRGLPACIIRLLGPQKFDFEDDPELYREQGQDQQQDQGGEGRQRDIGDDSTTELDESHGT
ncbi:hypothetical protein TWF506_000282 [Arthrobotrys conoides]|uniref:Ankyrin n=1 Tax=Arthrobotrys conoides TaxID=74498 RepID=A0AAN8RWI7_9PEZI